MMGVCLMDYFETRGVINRNIFAELKRHLKNPRDKKMFVIYSLFCFFVLILGIISSSAMLISSGVAGNILIVLLLLRDKIEMQRTMEKIRESLGIEEIEYVITFTDDQIKIHNLQTNGTSRFIYSDINRFVETKNLYALFTRANQFITVNKNSLIQEQKDEAFIQFIKNKCENVKW